MMIIEEKQIEQLNQLLDEAETAVGASMVSQSPFYILKAINDQIKFDGLDWLYDLNEKGKLLQQLYEDIYKQNTHLLDEKGNFPVKKGR